MNRLTTYGYPECECEWCGATLEDIDSCSSCWSRKVIDRLAAYENTELTPEECALYVRSEAQGVSKRELKLSKENQILRAVLIDQIKRWNEDLCRHCSNRVPCEKRVCEHYQEGVGGLLDDQRAEDFRWSCKNFDFGTCGKMVGIPCEGCFESGYDGFELDLGTFRDYGGGMQFAKKGS